MQTQNEKHEKTPIRKSPLAYVEYSSREENKPYPIAVEISGTGAMRRKGYISIREAKGLASQLHESIDQAQAMGLK